MDLCLHQLCQKQQIYKAKGFKKQASIKTHDLVKRGADKENIQTHA